MNDEFMIEASHTTSRGSTSVAVCPAAMPKHGTPLRAVLSLLRLERSGSVSGVTVWLLVGQHAAGAAHAAQRYEGAQMIKAGQRYMRPDGSRVRVDSVVKGQVYFVSWKPGQEQGCPIRMLITDFKIAIRNERMALGEPTKLPVFDEDNRPSAWGHE